MVTVEFDLLGQRRATAPAAWAELVQLETRFEFALPLNLELRTALMVRGVTFRVMLQPTPPAEPGEGGGEGGGGGEGEAGAEAAAEAEPKEDEAPVASLVGEIGSKWGPIFDGVATCTQQCLATVTHTLACTRHRLHPPSHAPALACTRHRMHPPSPAPAIAFVAPAPPHLPPITHPAPCVRCR